MTRKGSRERPWTVAEERFLVDSAGIVPRREICLALKRSAQSVYSKARELRRRGVPVEMRCFRSKLGTCPACGRLSATLGCREGVCLPCRRAAQLSRVNARAAALLARLPAEERETYALTEAELESRADPMPRPPDVSGMGRYRKAAAEEAHEVEVERWAARNIERRIKAAQKRKERIQKKVKTSAK